MTEYEIIKGEKTNKTYSIKTKIMDDCLKSLDSGKFSKVMLDDSKSGQIDIEKYFNKDEIHVFATSYITKPPEFFTEIHKGKTKIEISKRRITDTKVFDIVTEQITDEKGVVIGEAFFNVVTLFIDIFNPINRPRPGNDKTKEYPADSPEIKDYNKRLTDILDYLLDKIVDVAKPSSGTVADEIKKAREAVLMKTFKETVAKSAKSNFDAVKKQLVDDQKQFVIAQKHFIELDRNIIEGIKNVARMESESNNMTQMAERMYRSMTKMKKVDSVYVENGDIIVVTKPLSVEGNIMGDFKITFKSTVSEGRDRGYVEVVNQRAERIGSKYHHPHISNDKHMCFGNWSQLNEMIARYNYDVALAYIINALQSWNPDGAFGIGSDIQKKDILKHILKDYEDREKPKQKKL
jgi:hypothetical protein